MNSKAQVTNGGWKTAALNEVATIERSAIQPEAISQGTAYIGLEHIESGGKILGAKAVDEGELASSKFKFTERHVLYGKLRPYLAKIACPDFSGICSTDILPILPGPHLDRSFLCFFLRQPSMVEYANSRAAGANLPRLSPSALAAFDIPLPPLAEQRRIAEVLDRAEALRAKRRAALVQLDSLIQSLFLDFFGNPFSNPRGWPIFPFSEVCETTQGVQIPRDAQKEEPSEGYERYLYINDFYSDDKPKFIEDRYQQKRVTDDDVVMANTGSPGRVFKGRPGILSNNLFKITFDTKRISSVFFFHLLASDLFQRHLQAQMKQGIQSHLGHKTFGVQKLPLPPIELQREFARRVAAVEKLNTTQRASLAELDALFASLQHRAFRGEL